jgi:predicted membrane protein
MVRIIKLKEEVKMAKQSGKVLNFVAWLTGVIVSLAVGFALIGGTLAVPYIGVVNVIAGWIVVITTIISAILVIVQA